mmetsp:Transcript_11085/g.18573  ORF Transcript_11085/g.18573 Transcript_11085/m.18573 type:complete len:270 (-) Transcript_11085:613-1422(-)
MINIGRWGGSLFYARGSKVFYTRAVPLQGDSSMLVAVFLVVLVHLLSYRVEEGVLDGLSCRYPKRVVDLEHAREEIEEGVGDGDVGVGGLLEQIEILVVYELLPALFLEIEELLLDLWRDLQVELLHVVDHLLGTHHLRDLDHLVEVVLPLEKGLTLEHHSRQDAPRAPHVELVVVVAHAQQQLRPLEESRGHPAVELLAGEVVVGETPVRDADLLRLVVNEDVAGLDVPVDDASGVGVVKADENLEDVGLDVLQREQGPQLPKVLVLD